MGGQGALTAAEEAEGKAERLGERWSSCRKLFAELKYVVTREGRARGKAGCRCRA